MCGVIDLVISYDILGQSAVLRNTKLTYGEITQISDKIGPDWDKLAGLMDIPYSQREEIRLNSSKYPSYYMKAEQVFVYCNKRKGLTRRDLKKHFKELDRYDLENEMILVENQVFCIDNFQANSV